MAGKMIHFQQPFGAVKRELLDGVLLLHFGGGFRISSKDFSYLRFGMPPFSADTLFVKTVMPTKMDATSSKREILPTNMGFCIILPHFHWSFF